LKYGLIFVAKQALEGLYDDSGERLAGLLAAGDELLCEGGRAVWMLRVRCLGIGEV